MDGLLLLRIDAPLYFANVNPVKDALAKYERRAQEAAQKQGSTLHFIIIDLSPVYDVDASAIHFFKVRCGFICLWHGPFACMQLFSFAAGQSHTCSQDLRCAQKQGSNLHFIIADLAPVYDASASAIHFFKAAAQGWAPHCTKSSLTCPQSMMLMPPQSASLRPAAALAP